MSMSFLSSVERLKKMDLSEKRKLYKCHDRYTELKGVPTWTETYKDNVCRFVRSAQGESSERLRDGKAGMRSHQR